MDLDAQQAREHQRQETIHEAVQAADRIILDASDGKEETTNHLTSALAQQLLQRATFSLHPEFDVSILNAEVTVEQAADVACEIIDSHPEDSGEVRRWMLMQVAQRFIQKTILIFQGELLRWEIDNPAGTT